MPAATLCSANHVMKSPWPQTDCRCQSTAAAALYRILNGETQIRNKLTQLQSVYKHCNLKAGYKKRERGLAS